MASSTIQSMYPWVKTPLIAGAPMGDVMASPSFAVAVSQAGGLGFLAAGVAREGMTRRLAEAQSLLSQANLTTPSGLLPIGLGFLVFISPLEGAVEAVQKHPPAAVWLFAAKELQDYATWARALRDVSPKTQIWVQVGSVADAVEIMQTTKPDVLVCQGADAGGHGLVNGAGVISLLPEMADTLAAKGHENVPLVAAGGIADGRGVAASIALGAVGAAMGTRFIAATEIELPVQGYREAILAASDGGQVTVRDKVFDDLNPRGNVWPTSYDGRAIRNLSWYDKQAGGTAEDIRTRQQQAAKDGDNAANGPDSRINLWAGTGVGLVTRVQSAAEIVEEVRDHARKILERVRANI